MRPEFQSHSLNDDGQKKLLESGESFSALLDKIDELLPGASREKALAITNLQAASYNVSRGISLDPKNQKGYGESSTDP